MLVRVPCDPAHTAKHDDCHNCLLYTSGLDRQHAINLGLPSLMSPDMVDMVQNSAMPKMNQASGAYYVYPEYQEYLRKADIISIQILSLIHISDFGRCAHGAH